MEEGGRQGGRKGRWPFNQTAAEAEEEEEEEEEEEKEGGVFDIPRLPTLFWLRRKRVCHVWGESGEDGLLQFSHENLTGIVSFFFSGRFTKQCRSCY